MMNRFDEKSDLRCFPPPGKLFIVATASIAALGGATLARGAPVAAHCDIGSMQAAAPSDTEIVTADTLPTPVPHCRRRMDS